jgi:Na+/melibiose symporter-like transporter
LVFRHSVRFRFAKREHQPDFSTLGASPDDLPLFWLAAPVTGLLVQPVIGYLSDHTWHPRWGRRRPFFFIGALLASIAMFLMPNASAVWMAVLVLWMMDAAINVSMEPFRAFVGDKLDSSQQTAGYAMQTFFIGCGAVIASLLPEFFTKVMHVSNVPVNGGIPDSVRFAFYTGGAIYFSAVMWTVLTSQEAPPADMQAFERNRQQAGSVSHALKEIVAGLLSMPKLMRQLAVVHSLPGSLCLPCGFIQRQRSQIIYSMSQTLAHKASRMRQTASVICLLCITVFLRLRRFCCRCWPDSWQSALCTLCVWRLADSV